MSEAVPPQDPAAEDSVLGAMLVAPAAIDVVSEIMRTDGSEFYLPRNGLIYAAALALANTSPVDVVTLTDALAAQGTLEKAGGRGRIYELAATVPATANVAHYARIVVEMAKLRALIGVGQAIATLGWERGAEAETLFEQAETLVSGLRPNVGGTASTMTMYEAAEYLDAKFRNPPDEGHGIPTPWSFLPSMHGGRLYTLGGYQADGKTVQGAHYFRHAVSAGVKTGFLTLEMNKEDMAERVIANMGLPAKMVQSGRFSEALKGTMTEMVGRMALWGDAGQIIDDPAATLASIRRYLKHGAFEFLIVDHLHQFHVRPEYERQDLEAIIRGLWQMAREFNIPILLLAQLSRTGDKKNPYPRPTMASLRGSAMIEALSWAVYFIWRKRDEQNIATSEAEFVVAKNRSGPTGVRNLTFRDLDTRYIEPHV